MGATDRAHLRLTALLAAAAILTSVGVGVFWPSNSVPAPVAPVMVDVTQAVWNVTGCPAASGIGPGLTVPGGSIFSVDRNITLPSNATGCSVSSVEVDSSGFALTAVETPALVPGRTVEWGISVLAPDRFVRVPLEIVVSGGASP